MTSHLEELLAQYALGILPPQQHAIVERHLASDADARRQLRELTEAASVVSAAAPDAGPLGPELREGLAALGQGVARFWPFLDRVATLFDLPADEAEQALALVDDPSVWTPLRPGTRYVDVDGGPALGSRHAGLVRMDPGAVFPRHSHQGDESFIILQGTARDSQGLFMQPGDVITNRDGTEHSVTVGEQELIYAIVLGRYTFIDD